MYFKVLCTVIDSDIIRNTVVTPKDGKYFINKDDGHKKLMPYNFENRFLATYRASGNLIGSIALKSAGIIRLQSKGQMDEEVYNEEFNRISIELQDLRQKKAKLEKDNLSIEAYKESIDEIIKTVNEQQGLLSEFDDRIFNVLVEKIEVLSPAHFVFVLLRRIQIEEKTNFLAN